MATDNMLPNWCDFVPVKLYLWTLKFEFYIIFTICHKMLFSLDFPPQLLKKLLNSQFTGHRRTGHGLGLGLVHGPQFADPCSGRPVLWEALRVPSAAKFSGSILRKCLLGRGGPVDRRASGFSLPFTSTCGYICWFLPLTSFEGNALWQRATHT